MKRVTLLLMALALTFGLVHCKKQETNGTTSSGGIYISVKVEQDNGAKHDVHIPTGAVTYSNGDVILVGNGGHYVGQLTYQDGLFSGEIDNPSTSDYLHFYFVSGLQPNGLSGSTTEFNVNIGNQRNKLPVLSYGRSRQMYTDASTTYSCLLENQCGLVKFVPSIPTLQEMTLQGVKTTATISFANNSITPTDDLGNIELYSESNAAKWAVLLPQDAMPDLTIDFPYDKGYLAGTVPALPEVTPNLFYTAGVPVAMKDFTFSFGPDQHCLIARSNLVFKFIQYTGGNAYREWRFADQPYTTMNEWNPSEGIDLLGWGTWYSEAAETYERKANSTGSSYNADYLYPDNYYYNFPYTESEEYRKGYIPAFAGSGVFAQNNVPVTYNLGPYKDDWHVMSYYGVKYLFRERQASTVNGVENARYARATLDGQYQGVIIFPDHYTHPAGVPLPPAAHINEGYDGSATIDEILEAQIVDYSLEQWSLLEAEGVVFLPYTGIREGQTISYSGYWHDYPFEAFYWTNFRLPGTGTTNNWQTYDAQAHFFVLPFPWYHLGNPYLYTHAEIYKGCAVRLIRDVDYK